MRVFTAVGLSLLLSACRADRWQSYGLGSLGLIELPSQHVEPTHGTWISRGDTATYTVSIEPLYPGDAQRRLDEAGWTLFDNSEPQSHVARDILHDGWNGLELSWTSEGRLGVGRAIAVSNVLVTLSVEFRKGAWAPRDAKRFFESFRIPLAGRGPHRFAGPRFETFRSKTHSYSALHIGPVAPRAYDSHGLTLTEYTVSSYGLRGFVTFVGRIEPLPSTFDEIVKLLSDLGIPELTGQGFTEISRRVSRADRLFEFTLEGPVGTSWGRIVITLKGSLILARAVIAPAAFIRGPQTAEWFRGFKY